MSYLISVIGATGQGKSTFIRKYISGKRNCFVYDAQGEYEFLNNNIDQRRARYTGKNPSEFVEYCNRKKNTICVFEDATIFFQGMVDRNMRELIFSKRHSKNVILLVFHSINRTPPAILEASDYIVLFKTLDTPNKVKYKSEFLLPYFNKIKNMPNNSSIKIKMI